MFAELLLVSVAEIAPAGRRHSQPSRAAYRLVCLCAPRGEGLRQVLPGTLNVLTLLYIHVSFSISLFPCPVPQIRSSPTKLLMFDHAYANGARRQVPDNVDKTFLLLASFEAYARFHLSKGTSPLPKQVPWCEGM